MQYPNLQNHELAKTMLNQLKNPFDPKFVKYRVGATSKDKKKGIALFYIDAREVMKRLDDVCGMDGWARKESETASGCICELSVRMPYLTSKGEEKWILKSDVGEFSKTSSFKGASSDSFKRAAVNFGIGRYLYYIPNQWYRLNEYRNFEEEPELPSWAYPSSDLADWQTVAEENYDPTQDVGLDEIIFTDEEAKQILTESAELRSKIVNDKVKNAIIANLNNKK